MHVLSNEVNKFMGIIGSSQQKVKGFRLWSIGTSVPDILINFFKRILLNNKDDFEGVILTVKEVKPGYYSLTSNFGKNYVPYDILKNDQFEFKLGAMRQYVQVLISFGVLECSANVFELSAIDFLKPECKGKKVNYKINPNIRRFIDNEDIHGYENYSFDVMKLMSKLGLVSSQNIAFTCGIIYGIFHLKDNEMIEEIIQKSTKIFSGRVSELKKYMQRCGFDYFNEFIEGNLKDDWLENLSTFILEVMPYATQD